MAIMKGGAVDTAIKFGAGRYRQGTGILEVCGEEFARFCKRPFIVAGPRSYAAVKDRLEPAMKEAGLDFHVEIYTGHCSYEAAEEYAKKAVDGGYDEIVGIGGGKIMDFSKAVGEYAQLGVINVPTSVGTGAPFTCMSIMYTPEGKLKDNWRFDHEIDGLYMDLDVIANCPDRYTASGIVDSMAKYIEIPCGRPSLDPDTDKIDIYTAYTMSKTVYELLEKYGIQAIHDNREHKASKALDIVAYSNVATVGVISNMTRSFGQSRIAHAFYYCARTPFLHECANSLHGEIVAVGLLAQLTYNYKDEPEKKDAELAKLRALLKELKMPMSLKDIGIPETQENFAKIEDYLCNHADKVPVEARTHEFMKLMIGAMAEDQAAVAAF